jgi:hypothetical protein
LALLGKGKPLMFNAAPPPSTELIERVVGNAVATYLRAYGPKA